MIFKAGLDGKLAEVASNSSTTAYLDASRASQTAYLDMTGQLADGGHALPFGFGHFDFTIFADALIVAGLLLAVWKGIEWFLKAYEEERLTRGEIKPV